MALTGDERALLALHLVPGIGPRTCAALLARFGSAEAVLRASPSDLIGIPHIGEKTAAAICNRVNEADLDAEMALLERHQVGVRFLGQPSYPETLATLDVPPQLLYVKGTLDAQEQRAIALVGSRSCTSYGRRMAERIAHDLAKAGWTVISGLARGIDGCAHRGALKAQGRTVAVLAGGLSKIYPPEHAELAEEVAGSGALVTEAAMRMEPMAGMFPARNRIISGLCRGVVVIEANDKSGALITARHAAEQGREVFAVPGPVDSAASAGTLRLLREGAKLVRNADDVLEDLHALPALRLPEAEVKEAGPPPGLDENQTRVWRFLEERHTVDELTRHLELPSPAVTQMLTLLEFKKVVRRLPGNWYERA